MGIRFDGEFTTAAPRADVYAFLADPQKFAPCLPTFESLEMQDAQTALVQVRVGVGKIAGSAVVKLALDDEQPVSRAAYTGTGNAMGGTFDITTAFELDDGPEGGTRVRWTGELRMFGRLVALAGGLIRPIAKRDTERLVGAIQDALGGPAV